MTVDEAVQAVLHAKNLTQASSIRNDIAMEAMRGERPEAEADKVRRAFFWRWEEEVRRQSSTIRMDDTGRSWTGD